MTKTILITGSSDGIGLEAAKLLTEAGHQVILHGRSMAKLDASRSSNRGLADCAAIAADLASFDDTLLLAKQLRASHQTLDVLINNAGVFAVDDQSTLYGLDLRFVVNTIAPYLLTKELIEIIPRTGRIINLSSAAQAPVSQTALLGRERLGDNAAYAQSKLALTMWSIKLADTLPDGPAVIPVNPGSLLGTKMVRDAYGMAGKDIGIGAQILARLAIADEFAGASGRYFDNDAGTFGPPHPDAADPDKSQRLIEHMDAILNQHLIGTQQ